jgi:hypothetical protein
VNSSDVCDAISLMRALESFGFGVAIGEGRCTCEVSRSRSCRLISTESGDDLREIEAQRATISARRPASSRPPGTPEHGEDFEAELESVQTFC